MSSRKSSEYRGIKNINEHLFKILSKCECNKLFLGFIFAEGFSLWLIILGKYAVQLIKTYHKSNCCTLIWVILKPISDNLKDSYDVQDFNLQSCLQVQFILKYKLKF